MSGKTIHSGCARALLFFFSFQGMSTWGTGWWPDLYYYYYYSFNLFEWQNNRDRHVVGMWFLPHIHNSQGWARLTQANPGTQNTIWVAHSGSRGLSTPGSQGVYQHETGLEMAEGLSPRYSDLEYRNPKQRPNPWQQPIPNQLCSLHLLHREQRILTKLEVTLGILLFMWRG